MEPVQFMRYERLSDDVYWLNKNFVVRFNVNLVYYDKNGKRQFFHKEYEYEKNGNKVVTLKRSYDYYISIENIADYGAGKEYIIITNKEFIKFQQMIKSCINWFNDDKYKNLFVEKRKKLTLTSPIPTSELNGLPGGKYIRCDPVVLDFGGTTSISQQPGICITLSNPNIFTNITIDTLMGLWYTIKDLQMLPMAQNLLNYLVSTSSVNRFNIDDGTSANYNSNLMREFNNKNKGIEGRKIKNNGLESL